MSLQTKALRMQRKIRVWEILIICIIVILSVFLFLLFKILGHDGKTAVITIDSEVINTINLETEKDMILKLKGHENIIIEVKDGKIRVLSSDCPDKICVKRGFISKAGESIICLPNKLIIEIRDNYE